jgi:hypothetical protein
LPNCWRPIFLVLPKLYGCQVGLSNCWSCSKTGTKGGVQQLFWDNYWHLLPTTAPLLSLIFLQPVNSSFISSHFLSSHLSSCMQVEAEARGVPARQREAQPPMWCGASFFYRPVGDYHRPAVRVYRNCINGYHYLPLKFKFSN